MSFPLPLALVPLLSIAAGFVQFAGVPRLIGTPQPGVAAYLTRMEADGRTITTVSTTLEVRKGNGVWVVEQTTESPAGETVESVELEPQTLVVRKRAITQGVMRMVAAFDGGRAKGSIFVAAASQPFDVEIEGPVFADGASLFVVLGLLPLADGYTVSFRTFDLRLLRPGVTTAFVAAVERVVVPAGTFEAFRVEIAGEGARGERQTAWVATKARKVVRATTLIPEAGASLTTELVK